MKKDKIINIVLFVICFCSICYSINSIMNGNIYATLIRLSIIPIIFLPKIIKKLFKISISEWSEIIYIVFVFCAHFLGSIVNFYHIIKFYDNIMHFLSGFVVSFFTLEFLIKIKKYDLKKTFFNIIFIISFSFMIAGLWEYFEFITDKIFSKDAQKVLTTGVNDTMIDMILATLASCLFCLAYAYEKISNKRLTITNFVKQSL